MKALRFGIGLLFLLTLGACNNTSSTTTPSGSDDSNKTATTPASLQDQINDLAGKFLAASPSVALEIGILKDGQPQTFFYGETAKGSGVKPTSSNIFGVASVTKTFTATLLAIFADRGVVQLTDPLQKWMPPGVTVPVFDPAKPITLMDLVTHMSGLPTDFGPPSPTLSDSDLLTSLSNFHPTRAPGDKYEYSNAGFALLGMALENATQMKFQALVDQEINSKLGLTDTRTLPTDEQKTRLVPGYDENGVPVAGPFGGFPAHRAAGGLHATIDDLMKWLTFNMGLTDSPLAAYLPELQIARYSRGPNTETGMAWELMDLTDSGMRIISKTGGTPPSGYHSFVGFINETHTGVVVLTNYLSSPTDLGVKILGVLNQ